MRHLSDD